MKTKNLLVRFLSIATLTLISNIVSAQVPVANFSMSPTPLSQNSKITIQQSSNQNNNFDVYPNPNNGEFSINVSGFSEKAFVTIYNMMGQLILKEKVSGLNHEVNMRSSVPGTYHLIIFDNNQPVYRTKFLKN
jgi:hypothetical protein